MNYQAYDVGYLAGCKAIEDGLDLVKAHQTVKTKARLYAISNRDEMWAEEDYYNGFMTGYDDAALILHVEDDGE